MKIRLHILLFIAFIPFTVYAQRVGSNANSLDSSANSFSPQASSNKSKSKDSPEHKQIPRGITVWTVDETTGLTTPAEPDTTSYLRMNHVFASGVYGEYNTLGNNGTFRQNRIFIDRTERFDFPFVNGYDQVLVNPSTFHFTNTFSPITNLDYNECGSKTDGEDHLKATFAVNVNRKLGFGFKFDYLYARGYYASQNTSHFGFTTWGSYLGERYQAHLLFSTNHQKQTENGGITNDDYIRHPESTSGDFSENEIPTVLTDTWNINDNNHLFFTQRYSIGFNRRIPMTEQEKKAKQFAIESQKQQKEREADKEDEDNSNSRKKKKAEAVPTGRPDNAKIAGNEPAKPQEDKSERIAQSVNEANKEAEEDQKKKEEDMFMKDEYVPVTSFFHTAKLGFYKRNFLAYTAPKDYYANDYYEYANDSIDDQTRHTYIRNNVGIALLEGFNKWAKAGINIYAGHEYRYYANPLPDRTFEKINESSFLVGGQLVKHQGATFHFNACGEVYVAGTDAGQVNISGNADLNIPLFGDTLTIDAKASFNLLNPDTYYYIYKSRHFQWDNDLTKETRTHIEGNLIYPRTDTRLRIAVDNLTNYTYLGASYSLDDSRHHIGTTINSRQASDIQLVTAQLFQNFRLGILHWDNVLTFQKTTNEDVLPLPTLNVYSNLYLRFRIAKVLNTDFGADVRYFTEYNAPEYSPDLQSYVIQENKDVRTSIGNYPIVNVYFNFFLKNCRFYVMMSHVNCNGKGNYFLTPHYPINSRVFRFGLNWNFFN